MYYSLVHILLLKIILIVILHRSTRHCIENNIKKEIFEQWEKLLESDDETTKKEIIKQNRIYIFRYKKC